MNNNRSRKTKNLSLYLLLSLAYFACDNIDQKPVLSNQQNLLVLGIAQDAGFPQINCHKSCCARAWKTSAQPTYISCIGIQDGDKYYILDATPDLKYQIKRSQETFNTKELPAGIFLTHAHIGHYTGLIDLGREALGASNLPVHAMPKMAEYLTENGPWSQLVKLNNIRLTPLKSDSTIMISSSLSITPFIVPHRDEFSETVGYKIHGKNKTVLFIPDIDKWTKWDKNIIEEIKNVDIALLDGSFYQNGEIPGRDMSLIPHPFVEESMLLFDGLSPTEKSKIYFIHLNHTNPLLDKTSSAYKKVVNEGYSVANQGDIYSL